MLITVRVHPRASRAKASWTGERLEVWVTAPPVGGAANAAVLKAVAAYLDVPPSVVSLKSGAGARTKVVEVQGDNLGHMARTDPRAQGEQPLVVRCDCGFEVRGTADDVVVAMQSHAKNVHNMTATREQVLERAKAV